MASKRTGVGCSADATRVAVKIAVKAKTAREANLRAEGP
jgi:hypothetical protein